MTTLAPRGGQWLSAEEISALFVVRPETLALYSARGTLPAVAAGRGGSRLFDVETAATIFRRRGAPALDVSQRSFGRLGQLSLGAAFDEAPPAARRPGRSAAR